MNPLNTGALMSEAAHEVTIGDVVTLRRSDEPLIVLGLSRTADNKKR